MKEYIKPRVTKLNIGETAAACGRPNGRLKVYGLDQVSGAPSSVLSMSVTGNCHNDGLSWMNALDEYADSDADLEKEEL